MQAEADVFEPRQELSCPPRDDATPALEVPGRALVPVGPAASSTQPTAAIRYPGAAFLAHLIAVDRRLPQTVRAAARARRRRRGLWRGAEAPARPHRPPAPPVGVTRRASVARMERSVMRGQRCNVVRPFPDFASLHPGYGS